MPLGTLGREVASSVAERVRSQVENTHDDGYFAVEGQTSVCRQFEFSSLPEPCVGQGKCHENRRPPLSLAVSPDGFCFLWCGFMAELGAMN